MQSKFAGIREYNKGGIQQDVSQILLKDYLTSWLVSVKKISLKPSSYDGLESTATRQVIPRLDDFRISEITPEDIGNMLTEIQAEARFLTSLGVHPYFLMKSLLKEDSVV